MFTLTIEDKHGGIADEYSFEEGEFLVGRSHSADIILPSDNVSRRHARLYTVDGRCYVEDLGSANGVFVNGRRIHEVFELEGSAQIKVGDYYLHIKGDTAPAQEERVYCRLHGQNLSVSDQVFRITRQVNLVGRGKDCTITVIDPSVSRIHGKLTVERSGAVTLEDLKSSNGTFVNNERVEVATLQHRDSLRFGNVEFRVELPDLAPGEGRGPGGGVTTGEFDEPWQTASPRRALWMVLSIVGALVVLGVVLLLVFGDRLFGGTPPEAGPSAGLVAAAGGTEAGGGATDAADAGDAGAAPADEGPSKEEEIELLSQEGRAQVKNRQWDRAVETWKKVLDRDPLHTDARKAINQIAIWQRHQEILEKARGLQKEKKYGEAARLLRDVDETSVYFQEAKDELKRLDELKPSLIVQADALVKARDCEGALTLYEEARQIDPRDPVLAEKIAEAKEKAKRRCR